LPGSEPRNLAAVAQRLAGAVRSAGTLALEASRKPVKSWVKAQNSPVSEVDIAVDALLKARLEAMPWVREAEIERLLPDTIFVRLDERQPLAFWQRQGKLVLIDRDGYEIYDLKGNKKSEFKAGSKTSSGDLTGADTMTDLHFANFIAGIRTGAKLNAPIEVGNVSVTILQLSNIAWKVNRELKLDNKNGKILGDAEAMKGWGREYEKGWEPKI